MSHFLGSVSVTQPDNQVGIGMKLELEVAGGVAVISIIIVVVMLLRGKKKRHARDQKTMTNIHVPNASSGSHLRRSTTISTTRNSIDLSSRKSVDLSAIRKTIEMPVIPEDTRIS